MATAAPRDYGKCEDCDVAFKSVKCKSMHYNGKRHAKVVAQREASLCSIYITGLNTRSRKEDILSYFARFGDLKRTYVGPNFNYVSIVYEKIEDAEKVMNMKHKIHGKKLVLKRRSYERTNDNEELEHLLEVIKDIPRFQAQVNTFVRTMTPDLGCKSLVYNQVIQHMQQQMKICFDRCEVFPFGSTTTSLQFKNSDLDIFVRLWVRTTSEIACIKRAKNRLYSSVMFRNVIPITSAKIPIIKCVHSPTATKCDVNFRNMLGVMNSRLILHYVNLDPKLRETILVVKYWAKVHEISGRNHLFTNYSMVLMFLFYLQNEGAAPSVSHLQQFTLPTDPEVMWNMNILPNPSRDVVYEIKLRDTTTLALLKGFFSFYADFDFAKYIICPYLGRPVEKEKFAHKHTIPSEFSLYLELLDHIEPLKFDKIVCLQDPLELNINTCSVIFPNILERYVRHCRLARDILSQAHENRILHQLFSLQPQPINRAITEKYDIVIKMVNKTDYLLNRASSTSSENIDVLELWFKEVFYFVQTVFEKVCKFELTKLETSPKHRKMSDQNDVHELSEQYKASSKMNVWSDRNRPKKDLDEKLKKCKTNLDKEILITDHIWSTLAGTRPSTPIIECEIKMKCFKTPARVQIELTQLYSYKKLFKSFGLFVANKLPQWFGEHEKEKTNNV